MLESPEWNRDRALMLYPGNTIKLFEFRDDNYTIESDELAQSKGFQDALFKRLEIKDVFVRSAQKILRFITKTHYKRHNIPTKKKLKRLKAKKLDYVYVGIHYCRTDHTRYEKKHDMKPLDAQYYIDAMHLYRQTFKKQHTQKRLIFVFVSDDIQWGREKLLHRVKERDLYFGGIGVPDLTEAIGQDFALLANCNHTIESHGSFSYFAGAFAGGFKIKPSHFSQYRDLRHKNNMFFMQDPLKPPLPPRLSAF